MRPRKWGGTEGDVKMKRERKEGKLKIED